MVTADLDALRTRLTAAGQRWAQMRQDHDVVRVKLKASYAHQLAGMRVQHANLVAQVSALAQEAINAGLSENEVAALLGVSRARTLRRWLGKTSGACRSPSSTTTQGSNP